MRRFFGAVRSWRNGGLAAAFDRHPWRVSVGFGLALSGGYLAFNTAVGWMSVGDSVGEGLFIGCVYFVAIRAGWIKFRTKPRSPRARHTRLD